MNTTVTQTTKFTTFIKQVDALREAMAWYTSTMGVAPLRPDIEEMYKQIVDLREAVLSVKRKDGGKLGKLEAEEAKIEADIAARLASAPKLKHELMMLEHQLKKAKESLVHVRSTLRMDRLYVVPTAVVQAVPTRHERLQELEQQVAELEQQVAMKRAELEATIQPKTPAQKGQVTRLKNLGEKLDKLVELRERMYADMTQMLKKVRHVRTWLQRQTEKAKPATDECASTDNPTPATPEVDVELLAFMDKEGLDPEDPSDVELAKISITPADREFARAHLQQQAA